MTCNCDISTLMSQGCQCGSLQNKNSNNTQKEAVQLRVEKVSGTYDDKFFLFVEENKIGYSAELKSNKITTDTRLYEGDCLAIIDDNMIGKAFAEKDNKLSRVVGFSGRNTVPQSSVYVITQGVTNCHLEPGISSIEAGDKLFLSASYSGKVSNICPQVPGNVMQLVGYVLDASSQSNSRCSMMINLSNRIVLG